MTLLILYLLIAILVSFLCSLLEAVLLSINPVFVTIKQQENRHYAALLIKYRNAIDKPLSAILTLNTFAHTIGAAGVGAQANKLWGDEYLAIASAIITVLILVFSEIIPKTLGANYWKQLVPFTVSVLRVIMLLLYPFVLVSQVITRFLNSENTMGSLTRTEFSVMAEAGKKAGVFSDNETRIIQNIAVFDKVKIRDIMTPRMVICAGGEMESVGNFFQANRALRFSRIPLYQETIDKITGFVLKQDLLLSIISNDSDKPLVSLKRDILVVYEALPIASLYTELIGKNEHIALVVDEYGVTAGIVTLEDVIETVLGLEIVDETDHIADLQKMARDKWKERALRMGIDPGNS